MRCIVTATVMTLMFIVSEVLPAQEPRQIPTGAIVRVTVPGLGINKRTARVVASRGDTLFLEGDSALRYLHTRQRAPGPRASSDESDHVAVARGAVTRLEIRAGVGSRIRRGALIGGLGGFAGSYVLLVGFCQGMYEGNVGECPGQVAVSALLGGALGAGLGAMLGSLFKADRWEEVPLDQLRLQPVTTPDGRLGLAASLRF